ncbi:MAG: hypothetical protein AAGL66_10770 [Pseudomonadota bacterium]
MTVGYFITLLAFGTLAFIVGLALWNKRKTEELADDPKHRKSTLAADAPDSYGSK